MEEIGRSAFSETPVTTVKIPNGVKYIRDYAFFHCTSLSVLELPESINSIGNMTFSNCTSLKAINVDKNNTRFYSVDGVLFDSNKRYDETRIELVQYPVGKTDKEYSIPNGVIDLSYGAFTMCSELTVLRIPKSVTGIDKVRGITAMTGIEKVFRGCISLRSIDVDNENKIYSSENGILFDKNKTMLIEYPAAKTDQSYSIPDSVENVSCHAFGECESLKSLDISKNVKTLGGYFYLSTYLQSINVDEENQFFSSENGVLFNKDKTRMIAYPIGRTDKDYSIPDTTEILSDYAFSGCTSIISVTIPNSAKTLEYSVFENCSSLVSLEIPDSVTRIAPYVFRGCSNLTIYGYDNSTTETYAKENDIPFKIIGKTDKDSGIKIENSDLEGVNIVVEKSVDSTAEKIIYNITLKDKDNKEISPQVK